MTFSDFAKQNSKTQESSAITEIRKEILGSTQKFGMDRHMNLYLSHCLIAHRMQNHYLRPLSADSSGVWVKISKSLPIDK